MFDSQRKIAAANWVGLILNMLFFAEVSEDKEFLQC